MNILKTLEQQYPELYHRLYADQMLDIGEYSSHWSKEVYPRNVTVTFEEEQI